MISVSYSEKLKQENIDLWNSLGKHPFIVGYERGSLPLSAMGRYLMNDHLYVIDYGKCCAIAASKSQDLNTIRGFLSLANGTIDSEFNNQGILAKELGISTRTLNRRCNKLASGGAVWPVAHLTIEGLQEGVYAFLEVSYLDGARGESVATIRTIVEDFLIFDGQFARYSVYNLLLPGIASARNILEKVKTVRGIKYARIDFAEHDDLHHELFGRKVRTLLSRYDSGNRAPIASNLE